MMPTILEATGALAPPACGATILAGLFSPSLVGLNSRPFSSLFAIHRIEAPLPDGVSTNPQQPRSRWARMKVES